MRPSSLMTIAFDFSSKVIRSTCWLVLRHACDKARRVPNLGRGAAAACIALKGKDLVVPGSQQRTGDGERRVTK